MKYVAYLNNTAFNYKQRFKEKQTEQNNRYFFEGFLGINFYKQYESQKKCFSSYFFSFSVI